ncbi:hypothetical protein LF887_15635 [Chryseobacterium sp. MEBOG06]|uniref:hypothetical protein n=1 Tax=Chryseobacterium sp. MEBOG06 TaxID=2879938 RepID=UPI001F24781E|nr:hypothetical protein [Chryseobacterium sp. MEBOG06]UKB82436.1 hypothetical protein LF887_15635 [Chryseobacterium sp. MEBOG06]
MINIYNSKSIKLEVELSQNISFDNIFGRLNFTIHNQNLSNNEEANLAYLFVDFEYLKIRLEANEIIKNDLFYIADESILLYWKEWEIFMDSINIEETEEKKTENAIFFDRNYFRTGNIFSSFFFDDIMIFYVIENDLIKFKYWNKLCGSKIYEIGVNKSELISSINSFLTFFNTTNNYLKNKK